MSQLKPTTIEELKQVSQGTVVELPSFDDGKPFVAKVKRPSLLALAANGQIPNPLLRIASDLFAGNVNKKTDENTLKETGEVFEIIARSSLVEPTFEQLEEAGVSLTDMQYLAIYNYSQMGVRALEGFRSLQAGTTDFIGK